MFNSIIQPCLQLLALFGSFNLLNAYSSSLEDCENDGQDDVSCSDFTNEWVVNLKGNEEIADQVAKDNGYQNEGKVLGFESTYLFRKPEIKRSKREIRNLTLNLQRDKRVIWSEHQIRRQRDKRDVQPHKDYHTRLNLHNQNSRGVKLPIPHKESRFNDELWSHQWYLMDLNNIPTLPQYSLRISETWAMGFTGKGVVVTVMDDGLEWNHTDIRANYDPRASWDTNDNDSDPFPRRDPRNNHGTRCAGEIAMVANNSKCGVGVAFNAKVGGIRLLDGDVSDKVEGISLKYNIDHIDIYSASWGPSDNGETLDAPKKMAQAALEQGVREGRNGKGVIYVWATGNGGSKGDNCNCDGYVSSIYTIAIGSASEQGKFPWYGEQCASTMAVAYSSGSYTDKKISTTDLNDKCTIGHTGTSAAAPLAAGIFALVLEANPSLTWRDMQHLVAITSEFRPLVNNQGWKRNAAGLLYNSKFGFGLLNSAALVRAALKWINVPPKTECKAEIKDKLPKSLLPRKETVVYFGTNGCKNTEREINRLEHVQVTVSIEYPNRGKLSAQLTSPAGTVSTLLHPRPRDKSKHGFNNWTFTTVHFWGESPNGAWKLNVIADNDQDYESGKITLTNLVLHGTKQVPHHLRNKRIYDDEFMVPMILDNSRKQTIYDQNFLANDLQAIPNYPHFYFKDYGESLYTP